MKPHFATTSYTTVASAALTIIHSFNESLPLTQEEEFKIWQQTTILPTRASSIFALAKYANQNGCKTKVIAAKLGYEFPDYRFYRYTKEDVDNAVISAKLLYDDAVESGVEIEVKEFTLADVNNELKKGNVLLLRLNVKPIRNLKRNSSNYVIVESFNNREYSIVDTGDSARTISAELMQECFDTLESKKHRDHRMLIFLKQ